MWRVALDGVTTLLYRFRKLVLESEILYYTDVHIFSKICLDNTDKKIEKEEHFDENGLEVKKNLE